MPENTKLRMPQLMETFKSKLLQAIEDNKYIINFDEAIFSWAMNLKQAYSNKGLHIEEGMTQRDIPTIAVCTAVNNHDGLVHFKKFKDSVNQ